MQLPPNWLLFKRMVLNNIKLYCATNIWPFKYESFTAWLNNFDNELDEYLALQLIDSLIVRSKQMAMVGFARLLHSEIRQTLIEKKVINESIDIIKWRRMMRVGGLENIIKFSPIYTKEQAGESGNSIYRFISQELATGRYLLKETRNKPKVIVLVDDFIGSGEQFITDFSRNFELEERLKTQIIIYCPLIAYEVGIDKIKNKFPDIILLPVETINKESSIFGGNEDDLFKNDTINTKQSVKNHLISMQHKYASPNMPSWLGYDDAALPLAFEWGCPNQTPSILWMHETPKVESWSKLFSRRS